MNEIEGTSWGCVVGCACVADASGLLSPFLKSGPGNSCSGFSGSDFAGDLAPILAGGEGSADRGGARDTPKSERMPSGAVFSSLWFTELFFDGGAAPSSMLGSVRSGDGSGRIGEYVRGSETSGNE